MRKIFSTSATFACAAILAVLLLACRADDAGHKSPPAQSSAPATATVNADGARRITVAELQQLLEGGEAVVVDVRPKELYEKGHIKGAILMPTAEISTRFGELPKDKQIVFYCA